MLPPGRFEEAVVRKIPPAYCLLEVVEVSEGRIGGLDKITDSLLCEVRGLVAMLVASPGCTALGQLEEDEESEHLVERAILQRDYDKVIDSQEGVELDRCHCSFFLSDLNSVELADQSGRDPSAFVEPHLDSLHLFRGVSNS